MCDEILRIIYLIYVLQNNIRIKFIENKINFLYDKISISEDDIRNEKNLYKKIFSNNCRNYVLYLFNTSISELKKSKYDESSDLLDGLAFIQSVGATAMWKYGFDIGFDLELFVREFDRLDVESERYKLYMKAQV